MAVSDAHVFPGLPTPALTQLFFPKPPTTFLTCFCRGERQKYARKKVRLNQVSNSQPPGHESDMLTTEPPGSGTGVENRRLFENRRVGDLMQAWSIFFQGLMIIIMTRYIHTSSLNIFSSPEHGVLSELL